MRMRAVLNAAVQEDVRILILGAFGCGAFRNSPKMVARLFKEVLNDKEFSGVFSHVLFPILEVGASVRNGNLATFRHTFEAPSSFVPTGTGLASSISGTKRKQQSGADREERSGAGEWSERAKRSGVFERSKRAEPNALQLQGTPTPQAAKRKQQPSGGEDLEAPAKRCTTGLASSATPQLPR